MREILFSSVLKTEYYSDLESLLFFNPEQERVKLGIIESLEQFGQPEIVSDADFLHVRAGSSWDIQTLFALDNHNESQEPELAGVIIFVRIDDEIVILHVAVAGEYCMVGRYADEMLFMRFLVKLREIADRIRGVRLIKLMYDGRVTRMPV